MVEKYRQGGCPVADPILRHVTWKRAVAYWQGEQRTRTLHCARCGNPIHQGGRRGPWHLDVGHVVDRYTAQRQGWTVERINALTNTQPEHSRCNRTHGARIGARITNAGRQAKGTRTSGVWG